jgi:hypothetical protein
MLFQDHNFAAAFDQGIGHSQANDAGADHNGFYVRAHQNLPF